MPDPLILREATMPRWLRIAREFTFMQRSMTALRPHADVLTEARRSFLAPEDEATIRVWTCSECGYRALERFTGHPGSSDPQHSSTWRVTERVYVAVDREAWVERVARALWDRRPVPEARGAAPVLAALHDARAGVDALLGPEDDRAH